MTLRILVSAGSKHGATADGSKEASSACFGCRGRLILQSRPATQRLAIGVDWEGSLDEEPPSSTVDMAEP